MMIIFYKKMNKKSWILQEHYDLNYPLQTCVFFIQLILKKFKDLKIPGMHRILLYFPQKGDIQEFNHFLQNILINTGKLWRFLSLWDNMSHWVYFFIWLMKEAIFHSIIIAWSWAIGQSDIYFFKGKRGKHPKIENRDLEGVSRAVWLEMQDHGPL